MFIIGNEFAKQRRKDLKKTLRQIGDEIGVSHVAVLDWESGRKNPLLVCRRAWYRALFIDEETGKPQEGVNDG